MRRNIHNILAYRYLCEFRIRCSGSFEEFDIIFAVFLNNISAVIRTTDEPRRVIVTAIRAHNRAQCVFLPLVFVRLSFVAECRLAVQDSAHLKVLVLRTTSCGLVFLRLHKEPRLKEWIGQIACLVFILRTFVIVFRTFLIVSINTHHFPFDVIPIVVDDSGEAQLSTVANENRVVLNRPIRQYHFVQIPTSAVCLIRIGVF